MTCTASKLEGVLRERFGGLFRRGEHLPDSGECCVLEAVSVCEGVEWTDNPHDLDRPDVRPLNDAYPDDESRTRAMLRLAPLLEAWPTWSAERRTAWGRRVALETVRQVLPMALRAVSGDAQIIHACEAASTLAKASVAAKAAVRAAPAAGWPAAEAAIRAEEAWPVAQAVARAAAWAAKNADSRTETLDRAVTIWVEAMNPKGDSDA